MKVFPAEEEQKLVKQLMHVLANERDEGEKVSDFDKRLKTEVDRVLRF